MERRRALKTLALAVGGIMFLPACDRWTKASVQLEQPFLSARQQEVLAELAETLIPATDTPGAKALGVPAFVERMLKDCHEPEVQEKVLQGLNTVEEKARLQFGTSFAKSSTEQKEALLAAMEKGQLPVSEQPDETDPQRKAVELQQVYALLKGLTLHGYLTSEWVMLNHSDYQMMPGHYHGCVPLTAQPLT